LNADVIVIGAGIAGCSAAFHLSESGLSTLCLSGGGKGGGIARDVCRSQVIVFGGALAEYPEDVTGSPGCLVGLLAEYPGLPVTSSGYSASAPPNTMTCDRQTSRAIPPPFPPPLKHKVDNPDSDK
jgi:cation diffusion facilitator CzcD-associated flavoprotein CzcO